MFLDKWALKYCLMIIEVENKPSLFVCLFVCFGKISLEIMSDDHLVKNQALSQWKVLAI